MFDFEIDIQYFLSLKQRLANASESEPTKSGALRIDQSNFMSTLIAFDTLMGVPFWYMSR